MQIIRSKKEYILKCDYRALNVLFYDYEIDLIRYLSEDIKYTEPTEHIIKIIDIACGLANDKTLKDDELILEMAFNGKLDKIIKKEIDFAFGNKSKSKDKKSDKKKYINFWLLKKK